MKLPKCMQMLPSSRRSVCGGGLADELLEILSSDLASVDDWIMEKKLPFWDGQDCAICFCPIGRGDVGRRMRCSCWLHFECLGHGLGVKISERAVDDKQMSICPACNKDLGRVIPPGVVHRAVGDNMFSRPKTGPRGRDPHGIAGIASLT